MIDRTSLLDSKAAAIPLFAGLGSKVTKSDAVIANYIASHSKLVLQMTVSDLSNETDTAEVTISRFCKKLGLSGFQALKVELASYTQSDLETSELCLEDDTKTIASKIFNQVQKGLELTLKHLDLDAVDRAAQIIAQADRLLVYGYGTSSTICRDIGIRFVRFGLVAETITDPHRQATNVAVNSKFNTVLVVVSLSGSSLDLVESVKIAKAHGHKVILITSFKRSPLALLADEVLIGLGPEIKLLSESTVTRFSYLALVDILYTRVAILKNDTFKSNISSMRQALASYKI